MINKDENSCKKSIPRLVIFKQLQAMREWKDKKLHDDHKKKKEQE